MPQRNTDCMWTYLTKPWSLRLVAKRRIYARVILMVVYYRDRYGRTNVLLLNTVLRVVKHQVSLLWTEELDQVGSAIEEREKTGHAKFMY